MSRSETPQRVSDEAVRAKTGRTWEEWFAALDAAGASGMDHKGIVAHLRENYPIGGWWAQTVTVTYEQARGKREKHEQPDGYQVSGSKTVPVPQEMLFAAWNDPERRERWLAESPFEIHRVTPPKSMRGRWLDDGSRVDVYFTDKGPAKSQVAVNHGRLGSAADGARMKAFWAEQLERMKRFLTSG